ncbi:MAG: amidoligase family protein, partial [Proteobacteria bacterium]|nr:amidoligase family protein [Pseudomonadota bacterium]
MLRAPAYVVDTIRDHYAPDRLIGLEIEVRLPDALDPESGANQLKVAQEIGHAFGGTVKDSYDPVVKDPVSGMQFELGFDAGALEIRHYGPAPADFSSLSRLEIVFHVLKKMGAHGTAGDDQVGLHINVDAGHTNAEVTVNLINFLREWEQNRYKIRELFNTDRTREEYFARPIDDLLFGYELWTRILSAKNPMEKLKKAIISATGRDEESRLREDLAKYEVNLYPIAFGHETRIEVRSPNTPDLQGLSPVAIKFIRVQPHT